VAVDTTAAGTVVCRYRYRLRVTPARQRRLWEVFHSCRFVWNQALGRWNDLWAHEQVSMSNKAMHAELTDWRGRYDWLAEVPVTPQQQTINDLGVLRQDQPGPPAQLPQEGHGQLGPVDPTRVRGDRHRYRPQR